MKCRTMSSAGLLGLVAAGLIGIACGELTTAESPPRERNERKRGVARHVMKCETDGEMPRLAVTAADDGGYDARVYCPISHATLTVKCKRVPEIADLRGTEFLVRCGD